MLTNGPELRCNSCGLLLPGVDGTLSQKCDKCDNGRLVQGNYKCTHCNNLVDSERSEPLKALDRLQSKLLDGQTAVIKGRPVCKAVAMEFKNRTWHDGQTLGYPFAFVIATEAFVFKVVYKDNNGMVWRILRNVHDDYLKSMVPREKLPLKAAKELINNFVKSISLFMTDGVTSTQARNKFREETAIKCKGKISYNKKKESFITGNLQPAMFGEGQGKVNLDTVSAEALRNFLVANGVLIEKETEDVLEVEVPGGEVPDGVTVPDGAVLRARKKVKQSEKK